MAKVLIAMAHGSEELEAISISNVLRRGGVEVVLASVEAGENTVSCARDTKIVCDANLCDFANSSSGDFSMIVLPGGMPGAERLGQSEALVSLLKRQKAAGHWYGAICAAPAVALKPNGLAPARATCYPAFKAQMGGDAMPGIDERVVVDEDSKCVTSQGPGTAIEFGLKIVELLVGKAMSDEVGAAMLITF